MRIDLPDCSMAGRHTAGRPAPKEASLGSRLAHELMTKVASRCRAMLPPGLALLTMWLGAFGFPVPSVQAAPGSRPPNIVFLLADDLGIGDLGCYGQSRIHTPNLDRLAVEGMRLTQHYAGNAVCAPSRCVLLTGLHPGHASIRDNREVKPEGQWPLPAEGVTLASLLRRNGYATGAFGKWGLGAPGSSGEPMRQGFDRFFGYNCQRLAHNYHPTSLWDNTARLPLGNAPFSAHQKLPAGAAPDDASSYRPFGGGDYAPDRILDEALRFMQANRESPFLLYFPTTLPHLALQVPADSLAEYEGRFPEHPYRGTNGYLPHRTPRAAYAAMVSRMDRDIGRLLGQLDELGLRFNTIVVFTSDNGPLYDQVGGTDTDFFESARNFRGRKGSLYEGGVRVPCLVRWPQHVAAGTTSDRVTGFEDWLPTLLELAGLGKQSPRRIDGISFAPTLTGRPQAPRRWLYREFPGYGGQQSIRMGDWKLVRQGLNQPGPERGGLPRHSELYDLGSDPGETTDLADRRPEVVRRLERRARREHTRSAAFPLPELDRGTR